MTPSQLYTWLERRPKGALTLSLVYQHEHDSGQTVQEWPVSELPATGLTLAAHVLDLAQQDCEARGIPSAQYGLRWIGAELAVIAQKIITTYPRNRVVEIVPDAGEDHPTPVTGSIGAEILSQILRHKETESKQYHAGMQTILRAQTELIALLREENRELREIKKPRQTEANPEGEARAVALDKLTDMVVQHVGPKLPDYIDRAFAPPKRIAAKSEPRKEKSNGSAKH